MDISPKDITDFIKDVGVPATLLIFGMWFGVKYLWPYITRMQGDLQAAFFAELKSVSAIFEQSLKHQGELFRTEAESQRDLFKSEITATRETFSRELAYSRSEIAALTAAVNKLEERVSRNGNGKEKDVAG